MGKDEQPKTIVKLVGIVAFAVVLIVAMLQQRFPQTTPATIQVTGQGRAAIKPDAALINISVTSLSVPPADIAVQKTSEGGAKVMAALKDAGVGENDRIYSGLVVNPQYGPSLGDSNLQKIITFGAVRQITALVRGVDADPSVVDRVVSAAIHAGATQVGEVRYISTKLDASRQQARIDAIKTARENAVEVARASGVKLGRMASSYENIISGPPQASPSYGSNSSGQFSPVGSVSESNLEIVLETTITFEVH